MNYVTKIKILPALLLILNACNNTEDIIYNYNLLFPEAKEIVIPAYSYSESDTFYHIKGSRSNNLEIADTVSTTPVIAWDTNATKDSKLITTAIFFNPIHVENNTISNDEDIVWIWHSGLGLEKNGWVSFSEGKANINDSIIAPPPPSLQTGLIYYWGVWAWNSDGTKIILSSKPLKFLIN